MAMTRTRKRFSNLCALCSISPSRALRQVYDYGIGFSHNELNPENAVRDLISYLPVLAYDGAEHDSDRCWRHSANRHDRHLGYSPGAQMGERSPYRPPKAGELRVEEHIQLGVITQFVTTLVKAHKEAPSPVTGIQGNTE
jgi:hypothetical protein